MIKKDHTKPLGEVTFRCYICRTTFSAVPARVEDNPECEWHPWRYVAKCPECESEAEQAHWERALMKAWQNATGPKTPEGIAATSANLEGHPTPSEALRTRFNAMKHGMNSRVATYFPAKPGGYSQCRSCDVEFDYCQTQPCCLRQTGLFMKFASAFERKDPNLLMDLFADQQAGLFAIVQQLMTTIIADGGVIKTPRVHVDKEGAVTLVEYIDGSGNRQQIFDIDAHPLLRPLAEFVSRANLNMADMGMTRRIIDEEDSATGRLKTEQVDREHEAEHRARTVKALEGLRDVIERASGRKLSDPILIEHKQQVGETS